MFQLNERDLLSTNGGGLLFAFCGAVMGCSIGAVIGGGKAVYDGVSGHGSEAGSDMIATMKGCTIIGGIAGAFVAV